MRSPRLAVLLALLVLGAARLLSQGSSFLAPFPILTKNASTGLQVNYAAGRIAVGGLVTPINAGNVTVADNQSNCQWPTFSSCNFIYWNGAGTALFTTTTYATAYAPGNVVVGFVTSSGGNISVITPAPIVIPTTVSYLATNFYYFTDPSRCMFTLTTTAAAAGYPKLVRQGTGQIVNEIQTNTTAGTITVDCPITVESRTTGAPGVLVSDVGLLYGPQTTLSNAQGAIVTQVIYPSAPGNAGSTGLFQVGTPYTVTPVSLQLSTLALGTSMPMYYERVSLASPLAIKTDMQTYSFEQVFTTNPGVPTTLDIGGLVIHGSNQIF